MILWLLSCTASPPVDRCEEGALGPVVVAATSASDDYSAGALSVVTAEDRVCDVGSLHGDAVVDVVDGVVFAVNRRGSDVVRRYDVLGAPPTWEISTGTLSNPTAVVGAGDRLLVTRLADPDVLVVDATDGQTTGAVDLSSLADADGVPEAAGAVLSGDVVLVALQRLDRRDGSFGADPTGRIAGIALSSLELTFDVPVGPNPILAAHPDGGAVVAAEDGTWWRVHEDGTVQGPVTPDLGGQTSALAVTDDGTVVAVVRSEADHAVACLASWDGPVVGGTDPFPAFFSDVAVAGDTIWVAARRSWADPEGVPGGFVAIPLDACGPIPEPDGWSRGVFAPYDLAVVGPG